MIGVFKAYTTRVGTGPMPTELTDETGQLIRQKANEYGATTGRPRRCGWFDGVAARFSGQVNGFTGVALTRLDVLDEFATLKVCTGYQVEGKRLKYFPSSSDLLEKCRPVYEELPGWLSSTRECRRIEDLPQRARAYVNRLQELIGCPVSFVSVGPRREESIAVSPIV